MNKLILLFVFFMTSCRPIWKKVWFEGKEKLEKQGYTEIKRDYHTAFCCEMDYYPVGFKAKKDGKTVSGCMCGEYFKETYINFNQ